MHYLPLVADELARIKENWPKKDNLIQEISEIEQQVLFLHIAASSHNEPYFSQLALSRLVSLSATIQRAAEDFLA